MSKRRRSRSPAPAVSAQDVRAVIRDEISKALVLPPGAQQTSYSTDYLRQLQARGIGGGGATRLPVNRLDQVPFGPGVPLIPATIDQLLPSGRPAPRRFEYPVSWNLQVSTTRAIPWSVLRDSADQVSIMRSCIEVVKATLTGLEWSFGIDSTRAQHLAKRSGDSMHTVTADLQDRYADDIDRLHTFWEKPDRINNWTFSDWLGALMEDQLVLDATAAYPHLNLRGELHSLELIDPSTVKPLLDERGATPQWPHPSFQQVLFGFPRGEFTQSPPEDVAREFVSAVYGPPDREGAVPGDALIYKVRNRRTRSPYGFSCVEQALTDVDLWLRRYEWLKTEYSAGVTPDMIVQVEANMTPEQLRQYEAVFNDDLSGQSAERRRARFLPAGFTPSYPNMAGEKFTSDLDLHLIRLICAAFDVLPTSLGFTPNHGMGGMGGVGHQQAERDCYSKNVEVLTRAGWKKFEDVDISVDEFATRNPKTKAFEWQQAVHKTVADFDGEMIRFYNGRTLDLTVSPNHRMLLRNAGRSANEFIIRADQAAERPCRIPVFSTWDAPDVDRVEFPATGRTNSMPFACSGDDFAAFMGMYLAEGCCLPYGVQIAQLEKSKGFVEFRALIERMTGRAPVHYGGRYLRIFSAALRDYCTEFGKARDKYVSEFVKNMSTRQLEIFMHFYWLGDGWTSSSGGRAMATASKRLAGDLQEIAQKIGYSAGVSERPGRTDRNATMYHLTLRKSNYVSYRTERVPYKDQIYCVTVPNEILYVRDGGQPVWCGNTQLYRVTKPTAQWIVDLINEVSQHYLGMPKALTFVFHGLDADDEQRDAELLTTRVQSGLQTLNEGRDQQNLPRYAFAEADQPMVVTPTGPVWLNVAAQPTAVPGNLPNAPENQPAAIAETAPDPAPKPADDEVKGERAVEARKFLSFAQKRVGRSWRDFQFDTFDADTAKAANLLAEAGDLATAKVLLTEVA